MSVHYYVANIETVLHESTVNIKKEIKKSEVDAVFSTFNFLSQIRTLKESYNIALRNAKEFLKFMKTDNLLQLYSDGKKAEYLITNANRLVYNFSASIKTFIGYAEIAVGKKNKDALESFEKELRRIFDENLEYRFFGKLRNYVVHYGFPYTKMVTSYPNGINLICEKTHLLKYDGWGRFVTEDIKNMSDEIDIPRLIEKEMILITSIQILAYGYYVENFKESNDALANFCVRHKLNSPIVMKITGDNIETAGKQLLGFPTDDIMNGIEVLKCHPNIDVKINDLNAI